MAGSDFPPFTASGSTCTVPFDACQIHHVIPWDQGGRTDLQNLAPLCSRITTWCTKAAGPCR
ncbi:MAG TPA: HNH endonuclease signature motif containing protein [Ilumatobacter sp.]|nr:HNH endonuclease signature motif containing protein [Ilumatobacter sp.]